MKIGGVTVTPSEEVLVLPRALGDDIVIRARPADLTDYEEKFPKPKVPQRIAKGGVEDDIDSPAYREALVKWSDRRFQYLVIDSLEPSAIEWETVDLEDPKTWKEWTEELQGAGFSSTECNRIINCVLSANSLDENKLKEARDAFLRGQGAVQAKSSGRDTELPNTQSGQPANDSE